MRRPSVVVDSGLRDQRVHPQRKAIPNAVEKSGFAGAGQWESGATVRAHGTDLVRGARVRAAVLRHARPRAAGAARAGGRTAADRLRGARDGAGDLGAADRRGPSASAPPLYGRRPADAAPVRAPALADPADGRALAARVSGGASAAAAVAQCAAGEIGRASCRERVWVWGGEGTVRREVR